MQKIQPNNDQADKAKKKKFKKMKQMITEKLQNIKDEEVSDSEQVDLSVDLHPIKHYVDDKEEMIEQMFTSLGPTLIQNMLPPLLRSTPVYELKADCLIQLLGMSKKRIFTSIEGKELQSSSDSDIDSEDDFSSFEKKPTKTTHKHQLPPKGAKHKYIIDADTLNVSIDNEDDLESLSLSDEEVMKEDKKRKSSEKVKKCKLKRLKIGLSDTVNLHAGTSPISISSDNKSDEGSEKECVPIGEKESVGPKKGQTLLEILELEMRAKAIRSLLNSSSSTQPKGTDNANLANDQQGSLFDPNIKIKVEPPDPDIEIIEPEPKPEPKSIVVESDEEHRPETEESEVVSVPNKPVPEPQKLAPVSDTGIDSAKSVASQSTDNSGKNQEEAKAQGTSWTERYLDNKETEKLIKTSKMCTNIRKRMRLVRTMQQLQVKEKIEIPVVIGSISEYQQLVGSDSSSSAKEVTESNVPEMVALPEAQSKATADVVKNSSSPGPVLNLDKADLVCSDILEIDVSVIDDLDPDSRLEGAPVSCSVVKSCADGLQEAQESANGLREAQESADGLREVQESADGLREAQESADGLREVQESADGLRKAQESMDVLPKAQESTDRTPEVEQDCSESRVVENPQEKEVIIDTLMTVDDDEEKAEEGEIDSVTEEIVDDDTQENIVSDEKDDGNIDTVMTIEL